MQVFDALKIMADKKTGALLVVEDDKVAGFSLRSALQACMMALPTDGATPFMGITVTVLTPKG